MAHKIFVVLLLLVSLHCASVAYHDRRVYYGEDDNICLGADDKLALTILFDDRDKVQATINGGVICNEYSIKYVNRITPLQYTMYFYCWREGADVFCDELFLNQEYRVTRLLDIITGITMRSTVRNPTVFDKHTYDCQVDGNGAVDHYGPIGTIPPPSVIVYCQRVVNNEIRTA